MRIKKSFIKIRSAIRAQKGFTLVELIVTLVLVGIIGTFTTLFMYTGLNGYLKAKDTSEGALKAQNALDRISLELKDINNISEFNSDVNINYTSETLPGNRQITYNAVTDEISIDVNGSANLLLDDVQNFIMTADYADLNDSGGGNNEVEAINVNFTVGDISRLFSIRIFPRNMVPQPP
jgi:prepilin-type N-terminal cleavage/methylation domain-containing protein